MGTAELHYSITLCWLWGDAGGKSISMTALSGGRGGSTDPKAPDSKVMNNVFKMGLKTNHPKGVHGGPLPIGKYTVEAPADNDFGDDHIVYSAKLTMVPGGLTLGDFDRDGFYIHGRGKHGSDGCIVPAVGADFQLLMKALSDSDGGMLTVWP